MNIWTVIGRVGKDAVLRNAGDSSVLGWSLAVDAGYGERKVTTWVDCSLWGKRAESLADKIKKGGSGVWGAIPMPPNAAVKDEDLKTLVKWILAGAK